MTETTANVLVRSPSSGGSAPASGTLAVRVAERNWAANLRVLAQTQPTIRELVQPFYSPMEWVYARDGALTGIDGHQWWGGCSLPRRAAEFMFDKADLSGAVLCFLQPSNAAQLRVVLNHTHGGQATLALVPDLDTLRMILACEDFSPELAARRLYFAGGDRWEAELDRLLEANPGLPIPSQFVRPILLDSSLADALIEPAQAIFANISARRSQRMRGIREAWRGGGAIARVCLVAPSRFRLWDDAGATLDAVLAGAKSLDIHRFDSDDPASASPLALAEAAARCDAIVTPNSGRADLPDIVPKDMPWATWITTPRIPPAASAGPRDTLILADPAWKPLAVAAGWAAGRIFIGQWPNLASGKTSSPGVLELPPAPSLAIICDTRDLAPPARVEEYSSHRVLWESIAHELTENPFALSPSPEAYLSRCLTRCGLTDEGVDRRLFLDNLITPAYQQGLARLLIQEQFQVNLFGVGWDAIEPFKARAVGPLRTREQFTTAIARATALVHVWPTSHAHPIDAAAKPVVRAHSRKETFLREARLALAGMSPSGGTVQTPITEKIVENAARFLS